MISRNNEVSERGVGAPTIENRVEYHLMWYIATTVRAPRSKASNILDVDTVYNRTTGVGITP